jgi:hypothetical protein
MKLRVSREVDILLTSWATVIFSRRLRCLQPSSEDKNLVPHEYSWRTALWSALKWNIPVCLAAQLCLASYSTCNGFDSLFRLLFATQPSRFLHTSCGQVSVSQIFGQTVETQRNSYSSHSPSLLMRPFIKAFSRAVCEQGAKNDGVMGGLNLTHVQTPKLLTEFCIEDGHWKLSGETYFLPSIFNTLKPSGN